VGLGPRLAKRTVESFWREQLGAVPKPAPKTMFNVNITGARRFAAQSWDLARIKAVGKPVGATVNDVILAMCGGSLRAYLREQEALPDASLIAMVPVSLAPAGDSGGNAVGATLCSLATDLDDPVARLTVVHDNQVRNKESFEGLSKLQATALSVPVMAPLTLNAMIGLHRLVSPFNLVISNVPGPPMPLYWGGAHLQGMWPLSIPMDGQALNITVLSNDGKVGFGLTGCRSRVPHLQRMLTYLEDELAALERDLL
jgi:WS/DGAT/MGAT family acyltransferase